MLRKIVIQFVDLFKPFVDLFMFIFLVPSALVMKVFRVIGSSRLPISKYLLFKVGVFPIRDHYYEPLFNSDHLNSDLNHDRVIPGISLNVDSQKRLLSKFKYSDELLKMELEKKTKKNSDFCIKNGSFDSGDAELLYQFIRVKKPRKVIEIGSGNSTKIAKLALDRNFSETNLKAEHICIEPYEMPWLENIGVKVIRDRVENCPISIFTEMSENDLLFIDSSHVIRPQGDVLHEYLTIIPLLKKGVYVHVHDIFTPKDYLKKWVIDDVKFWNEQYLLEVMLSHSSRYKVTIAANYLKHHHYDLLAKACPYLTEDREPGSFYFQVLK